MERRVSINNADVPGSRDDRPMRRKVEPHGAAIHDQNAATRRGLPYVAGVELQGVHSALFCTRRTGVVGVGFTSLRLAARRKGRIETDKLVALSDDLARFCLDRLGTVHGLEHFPFELGTAKV